MIGQSVLGFIPAKGCSQRFPGKNLALLDGKPLLEWAIQAARSSGICNHLAVSSESPQVLDCAGKMSVDSLIVRPDYLARDPCGIVDVALHSLDELSSQGKCFDTLIILTPTSPLRTSQDIINAYELFKKVSPNCVLSVAEFSHTPFAALEIGTLDGHLKPIFPDHFGKKSQEMPIAYRPNGAIQILNIKRLKNTGSYLTPPLIPYIMPRSRSVDVDNPEDLLEAQVRLKAGKLLTD